MTRKEYRERLNKEDAESQDPKSHKHGPYHQRTRLAGDYLWFQDRDMFEMGYQEVMEKLAKA